MSETVKMVDFEAFKNETGLDDDLDKELYLGFLEEISDEKEKILTQLAVKDYKELAKTVHNVKGVSGSYMSMFVYEYAKILDTMIKERKIEDIDNMVTKLTNSIVDAVNEIKRHYMFE
jgi:HPt (histidine-containing phosphotransfer) domain-containing protein